jgi:Right handed beta helix region
MRGFLSAVVTSGMRKHDLLLALSLFAATNTQATLWQVGNTHPYTLPSQVSTLVQNADTVEIDAGIYVGDVCGWTADDLVLRGVGGLVILDAQYTGYAGKAIWVISGDRTTVEGIQFHHASVPDQNGAGIRQEGAGLVVRNCVFYENEDGILANAVDGSTIRITNCEFDHNGFGDGQSHNLYINSVDSLIFEGNYSHHAHIGHELKSRAKVNVIRYNRFSNEADGDASREIDLPNGGQAYLIGNVIQQGPYSDNGNMLGFGLEGLANPAPHALLVINNTFLNERFTGSFLHLQPGCDLLKAWNNIFAGPGSLNAGSYATVTDTLANLRAVDASTVLFTNIGSLDLSLTAGSPAENMGYPAGLYNAFDLSAYFEYVHPAQTQLRCQHATLAVGAYELCTTGLSTVHANTDFQVTGDRLIVPSGSYNVIVYNAQGAEVMRMRTSGVAITMDLSSLPPGAYVAQVAGVGRDRLRFVR